MESEQISADLKFARFLSYLFHAYLMPTLGVFVLIESNPHFEFLEPMLRIQLVAMVFIITFLLPLSAKPVVNYMPWILNNFQSERNQYIIGLLLATIANIACSFLLAEFQFFGISLILAVVISTAICVWLNLVMAFVINLSTGMVALGNLTALVFTFTYMLGRDLTFLLIGLILFSGFFGFASLRRGKHTASEIYIGYGLGFIATSLLFVIINN